MELMDIILIYDQLQLVMTTMQLTKGFSHWTSNLCLIQPLIPLIKKSEMATNFLVRMNEKILTSYAGSGGTYST